MKTLTAASTPRSAGITLTEILISILILGVGLVSLATLFPIGLLRLREAQRQTRSAYLFQSATADAAARGLFNSNSFVYADLAEPPDVPPVVLLYKPAACRYNPLTQDTPAYGADPSRSTPNAPPAYISVGAAAASSGGYGLPFAYDPLWRYWACPVQTNTPTGTYLFDNSPVWASYPNGIAPEARFAAGNTPAGSFLRPDPSDQGLATPMACSGSRTSTGRR